MEDIILSPANFWFSIALVVVLFLFVLEIISTLFGASILSMSDDVGEIESEGFLGTEFANWLNINKVPFLVWLVILLIVFGLAGLILNGIAGAVFAFTLPTLYSVPLAFVIGVSVTSKTAQFVAVLLPTVETSAITNDEFVGVVAEITIGKASKGNPAEAKFTDSYSQSHFVLVEPFEEEELFTQGERVILVQKNEHSWLAIRYH